MFPLHIDIGTSPEVPHAYFVLGFGGNGITFSVVVADMLRDLVPGKKTWTRVRFALGGDIEPRDSFAICFTSQTGDSPSR